MSGFSSALQDGFEDGEGCTVLSAVWAAAMAPQRKVFATFVTCGLQVVACAWSATGESVVKAGSASMAPATSSNFGSV